MILSCKNSIAIVAVFVLLLMQSAVANNTNDFGNCCFFYNTDRGKIISLKNHIAPSYPNFITILNRFKTDDKTKADNDIPTETDSRRLLIAGSTILSGYSVAFIFLDRAWYRNYPRSSFHFHNDNLDWLQMDKAGHAMSSYYLSSLSYKTFRWTGMDNRKATLWGSFSGWAFISTIEVFDGFSAQWGASLGDLAANTLGAVLFTSQQLTWEQQKVKLKFSFHQSGLEKYRPDLLGSNLPENVLKDYNGQTYWLSFNLNSFANTTTIPDWLNIAFGYGASGMLGSRENPLYHNGQPLPYYTRSRHYYIAPDIDWGRIKTNSVFIQSTLSVLDFLKMPAPAIEYSKEHGFAFHFIFF